MKISDLTETPYLHPGEMPPPSNFPNGSISLNAIKRDFTKLYATIIEGQHVTFFIDKHQNRVLGFVIPTHSTDADRVIPKFSLFFKENTPNIPDLTKTKCLQIDSVFLNKHLRVSALTSQVYFQLAKLGYTIFLTRFSLKLRKGCGRNLLPNLQHMDVWFLRLTLISEFSKTPMATKSRIMAPTSKIMKFGLLVQTLMGTTVF